MTNEKQVKEINKYLELKREEKEELLTKGLTSRQHRLKDYLKKNFQSGRYFSIEEICQAGLGYVLNTNPKAHDKCLALSNDCRAINWCITERYIPIIKDSKGGCKLAESKDEVDSFIKHQREQIETKAKYLNIIESKIEKDGYAVFINLKNRVLDDDEIKPIEVFAHE